MDIGQAEVLWRLGKLTRRQVDQVATELLAEGCESPAVLQLASGVVDESDYDSVFGRALQEMGRPPLSEDEGVLLFVKRVAADIIAGRVDPDEGARAIASWDFPWYDEPDKWPDWFKDFWNIVDDWDDYFWSRPTEYVEAITKASKELLDRE